MSGRKVDSGRALSVVTAGDYQSARDRQAHVFLVGDLKLPTNHPFFIDSRLEFILTAYEAGEDGLAHWHPGNDEYIFCCEGEMGFHDMRADSTLWLQPGDLICVPKLTCTKRLIRRKASGVSIKVPSSSEKVTCAGCTRDCPARSRCTGEDVMVSTPCKRW